MTSIAILPVPGKQGEVAFEAVAGAQRSEGRTAGEALDALTAQLRQDDGSTLILLQHQRPDAFFAVAQQLRLRELMERWRAARDRGESLPAGEQAELDALVATELAAAGERAAALADASGR
jgi:hypothetical protein